MVSSAGGVIVSSNNIAKFCFKNKYKHPTGTTHDRQQIVNPTGTAYPWIERAECVTIHPMIRRGIFTLLVVGTLFGTVPHAHAQTDLGATQNTIGSYSSGRVLDVRQEQIGTEQAGQTQTVYEVELRGKEMRGRRITVTNDVTSNPYQLTPRKGDHVVIYVVPNDQGDLEFFLEGFDRRIPLAWLVVLFVLVLVALAGWQGLKVAFSICVSIALIGWVLIPSFLNGVNPVPIAILLVTALTFLSTGLSTGWNKQSVITALGTLGGVIVAYGVATLFAGWSNLSGLATEEDRLFFSQNPTLNPSGLLFAGIIIAAMGIIEDVAVSIASGVEQVRRANHALGIKELFRAGMVIGRDHTAALANTLIFAYVGASLSTLLLYAQYDGSWLKFLNFDTIADEVIRSLAGTIGLILTVPVTALLAAWISTRPLKRGGIRRKDVEVKTS